MIQMILQCKRFLAAGLILLLLSVVGCGTGEYEQRLRSAAQQLNQESAFADMKPAAQLSGTTVTLKIPGAFQSQPLTEETQIDGAPIDPRRVKPAELNIPGLQATYEESMVDTAGGKLSYYCYLAVVDMTQGNAKPMDLLRRQAQTKFPQGTGVIEPIECPNPQGQTIEWKKLRCTGDQEFYYVDQQGNADFRTMPGAMEFYARQEGNVLILVAWRVPTDENGNSYVEEIQTWAPRVAGSITP